MSPPEPAEWAPSQVDYRAVRRAWGRSAAIAFNLVFLVFLGLQSVSGNFGRGAEFLTLFTGMSAVVASVAAFRYSLERARQAVAEHTKKNLLEAGKTPGSEVNVRILREGVELGCDAGWISREAGALTFEGEYTRFGLIREDLDGPPGQAPVELTALRVKTAVGEVVVEVRPRHREDPAFFNSLLGWPDAPRSMPGPPTSARTRTRRWYLNQCAAKMAEGASPFLWLLLFFAAGKINSLPFELAILGAICVATGAKAKVIYKQIVAKDQADLARFAALDAPRSIALAAATDGEHIRGERAVTL